MPAVIESRTIDGRVFISVEDTCAALRERANEFAEACNAQDDLEVATAYRAVTEELRARADWLDVSTLAYIST